MKPTYQELSILSDLSEISMLEAKSKIDPSEVYVLRVHPSNWIYACTVASLQSDVAVIGDSRLAPSEWFIRGYAPMGHKVGSRGVS